MCVYVCVCVRGDVPDTESMHAALSTLPVCHFTIRCLPSCVAVGDDTEQLVGAIKCRLLSLSR